MSTKNPTHLTSRQCIALLGVAGVTFNQYRRGTPTKSPLGKHAVYDGRYVSYPTAAFVQWAKDHGLKLTMSVKQAVAENPPLPKGPKPRQG